MYEALHEGCFFDGENMDEEKNGAYWISEDMQELAAGVIKNVPELNMLETCAIGYYESTKVKKHDGMTTLADCRKVDEFYKPYCPYDYIITVYDKAVEGLSDKQMEILMEHELMHIDYTPGTESIAPLIKIRPHNTQEFREIIKKYGIDWDKPV